MVPKELVDLDDAIKDKIYTIRGKQVMLDRDLAELYRDETKVLNQAVKRNLERFPADFMFQLTETEFNELVTNCDRLNSLKHSTSLPYVFAEQGVAMLSGLLRSKVAIDINIKIMRAFVAMRHFLLQNANVFQKFQQIDQKFIEYDDNFNKIFEAIESKNITPDKGIFFDGQVFDAYSFVSDLVRSANRSIILIDNFIDDSVLTILFKKKEKVKVTIYTSILSKQLELDREKFNKQYGGLEIKEFNLSHDRFLLIDENDIYHIGASLKDLGKRWFGFSIFGKEALTILEKLK